MWIVLCAVILFASPSLCQLNYNVNINNVTGTWNHFFEQCVGSGHAALALRADYQAQLSQARAELGFQQVRFHGLFVDDMSVVLPAEDGSGLLFSFFNIDRVFDFLLNIGMKPLVELSFMPELLASGNQTWSHYDANVTPPKNMTLWTSLVTALVTHVVDRYGLDEILTWNFEVWNEPNCCPNFFWTGTMDDYFSFFNHTSHAVKAVDKRIRVGGPATAMSSWIPDFLAYCKDNQVPFDFVSTHEYPTDPPGPQSRTFFTDRLAETRATVGPDIPLYYTEYDDGYNDATSYGAGFVVLQNYLANNIVDILSFWVFSDIFEEGGQYPDPYSTTWMPVDGLMNVYGIPKPNYRAFQLLHWTGDQLVDTQPNTMYTNNGTVGVFAVTGNNTSIFVVNWNVMNHNITQETVRVTVSGLTNPSSRSSVGYFIDSTHTTSYPTWLQLGQPLYLTPKQVQLLQQESQLVPQQISLTVVGTDAVSFEVVVQPQSVVNVIII